MPPCARSNAPTCDRSAPVNAPRSWPNSSLSISVGGSAPQSTTTNGRPCAAEVVQRSRDQLLARAGLARDQHRDVASRRLRDVRHQPPHHRRATDHAAERLVAVDLDLDRPGIADAQGRVADPEQGAWWDHRALDPQRAGERTVGRAVVDHEDPTRCRPQLGVKPRHRGVGQPQRTSFRRADRDVIRRRAQPGIGTGVDLDRDAAHREMSRTSAEGLVHAAVVLRAVRGSDSNGWRTTRFTRTSRMVVPEGAGFRW